MTKVLGHQWQEIAISEPIQCLHKGVTVREFMSPTKLALGKFSSLR